MKASLSSVPSGDSDDPSGLLGGLARHPRSFRQPRDDQVEQIVHAAAVAGGDREDVGEAERERLGGGRLGARGVDLVGGDQHRAARLAQHLGDVAVDAGDPLARVDHEDDQISLVEGAQRLLPHRPQDPHRRGIEAAGVDDAEMLRAPVGDAVAAIARHAGDVLDQRRPAADEAVVERRLADVGTPDQRDERKICVAHFWYPSSAIASGEVVQSGSMRTVSLMCAGRCKSSLMATRARVPTSRIIVPPLPSTIAR